MTTIEKYENENALKAHDFDAFSKLMFQSFLINRNSTDNEILNKKEELISSLTTFLEKFLELKFADSKQDTLKLIDLIDKMNIQKELVELQKNQINLTEIEAAAQSLGKKSQSAFKGK